MLKTEQIAKIKRRLLGLEVERQRLKAALDHLQRRAASTDLPEQSLPAPTPDKQKTTALPPAEKIQLFRSLFKGRTDVFPRRWDNPKTGSSGYSPACANEWVRDVCQKPKVKCGACLHQAFIPVSDDIIRKHLSGKDQRGRPFTAGIYPLLPNDTCWFLAVDFDKFGWQKDVQAFLSTCRTERIPACAERSRSGNGAHVWFFFSEAVAATSARKLGSYLITKTMDTHPDLGFGSYDRMFPSQDSLPKGGFGNLIALPLQASPRKEGNSLFLDKSLEPHADQWAFLQSLEKISTAKLTSTVTKAISGGQVTGLHMPVDGDETTQLPSAPRLTPAVFSALLDQNSTNSVTITLRSGVHIDTANLPAPVIAHLIRLAAFQNPEFYRAQAMRMSTYGKPSVISCAQKTPSEVILPRGCLAEAIKLFETLNVNVKFVDMRNSGDAIQVKFLGKLTDRQKAASADLLAHETGVLSATTGFGKTVLAASLIAARGKNTLILVHRQQLADQWKARLETFLAMDNIKIGSLGGGKRRLSGQIDIALIQSLVKKQVVDDCIKTYGHLIVDECHHISAVSFEAVAQACEAKYVLGLTATPTRKDGHQPIIFMQCGSIRHTVSARAEAGKRSFTHLVSQEIPTSVRQKTPKTRPFRQFMMHLQKTRSETI